MTEKTLLLVALALTVTTFLGVWIRSLRGGSPGRPSLLELFVGFVTNFFDTLGIGSYAPTTSIFKLKGIVPDERIPGTLTIGHTPPTVTQAFIFITLVTVAPVTLIGLIAAAVAGAWLGAGTVAGWPRRNIQIGMGVALLAAAGLFVLTNLGIAPGGGEALGLTGIKLAVGLAGSFVLGAMMTIGVGYYGPCMIMISLLGMNSKTAFPIMMGACAFLMPISGLKFLRAGSYAPRPALGLALGGFPAVLIAAFIVKALPLATVRWLVVVVVLYSATQMLRSAWAEAQPGAR
ncbi:MAG TPA: sulfite exporter TauE/SafE family protein [Gemmatimonadales bacterium]